MCAKHVPTGPGTGGKYYGVGHGGRSDADLFSGQVPAILASAVSAVTANGEGFTLSRTRDGGAVCVAVLSDGVVSKWYAATPDELCELLEELRAANVPS